ncbi:MAG: TspO/MBR family protein [Candidatus Woesearchaeota archaeon]
MMHKTSFFKKIDFKTLIFSIVICQLAGVIGSIFTAPSIDTWYKTLEKPFFTPPNWLFAPVWILLFFLMGISLYLILKEKKNEFALRFFFIQLGLNTLWSILFFGLQSPVIAFVDIILLWTFILLTIISSYKINRWAAFILIPYILWVSFASALNIAIAFLN